MQGSTGADPDIDPDIGLFEGVQRVQSTRTVSAVPAASSVVPDGLMSRETLLALAHHAADRVVSVPPPVPDGDLADLTALVSATRDRADVATHVEVLAAALRAHLAVATRSVRPTLQAPPTPLEPADSLLRELDRVVEEYGLTHFRVDALALTARRALLGDDAETALGAITAARTLLDEPVLVDHAPTVREHGTNRQRSLRLVAGVLTSLGMHELAVPLVARARRLATQADDALGGMHADYELVRIDVSRGLRLQRAGQDGAEHLHDAATRAGRLTRDADALLPADLRPLLRAAVVLHRHSPGRAPRLVDRRVALLDARALRGRRCAAQHDHVLTRLALARALERAGRGEDAVTVLEGVRDERPGGEPDVIVAVLRELARLRGLLTAARGPGGAATEDALRAYTDELEAELWSLRQARVLSLETRVAHERLRREHGEMSAQARTDPLTGLLNRRALDDVLGALAADGPESCGGQVSVAVVDVDHFKRINDQLSHAHGDQVLRGVAELLRRTLRGDDVVARFGGDEFVVVLPGLGADRAVRVLARAVAAARAPVGDGSTVSLSAGVAEMFPLRRAWSGDPDRTGATDDVLVRADAAMYAAKRAGGDAVRREGDGPEGPAAGAP